MELKIRKITDKVEIDTYTQGCWSDCHTGEYSWHSYNGLLYEMGDYTCYQSEDMNAKTNWFL